MATERELSLTVETFNGINQQVDREALGPFDSWQMQNLWERVIGVPETRGHSVNIKNSWPSNINGIDNINRIFKNTLDHKRIVALHGAEETPGVTTISLPGTVTVSWVAGGTDPVGNGPTWLTAVPLHADIGYTPKGIILRFVGYGFDKTYTISDATTITGYSAGSARKLRIAVSGAMPDVNITAIEVYAICSHHGITSNGQSSIWVGNCDLIGTPTGNFDFYHAPISKVLADNTATATFGSLFMAYTITSTSVNGGTLLPGKTYYIGCMPQYFVYNDSASLCQNAWRQFGGGNITGGLINILSITLPPGQNAIIVKYPPASESPLTFNSLLVSIGESPQLMIPYFVSNVAPASPDGNRIAIVSSFPQNTPAVVDIEYLESISNEGICNLRFRQSDFSTYDCLSRVNSDGTTVPVFISRQSSVNRYDNAPINAANYNVTISSDGTASPGPYIKVSPNLVGAPYWTDPIPAGTPVTFSGSGSPPGGISFGTTYFWLQNGISGQISSTIGGTPIGYSSAGTSVTMSINPIVAYSANFYPSVGNSAPITYTGSAFLSQPLISQKYSFVNYQDLAYFVTGVSNNPSASGPQGFPNTPISGSNYYVSDGTVCALVVFDYSTDPTLLPSGTVINKYQDSIVISGGLECGDSVYFSRFTNPWNFEVPASPGELQFFQIEGLGEWVTGFNVFSYSMVYVSPQSFLVMTKKNSTWILENLPTFPIASSSFIVQISKAVGCPRDNAIVQTPVGVLFPSNENVYMVKGGGDPVPIGDPISYILKASDLSNATAEYHDEQYKLSFYNSSYPGTAGYNNVELWLDIKKMKQAQGKPDWKGPMLGRQIDYSEVENLTGDGVVDNLTRDRICIDRQNIRVFKADVIPAESDTVITDFGTPVVSLLETKTYKVEEKDNNWNKLFTRCLWKVRTNASPLSSTVFTYVDGVLADTKTVTFTGLAATDFDLQPQVYTMEFPTGRYRGRTIKKIFQTSQRVGIGGFTPYYQVERRRIGS